MAFSRDPRFILTGLTLVALIAATTGITYATTAGSTATGVVYACANSKGTLRLLTASGTCAKGFHEVAINQRGPAGPAGPGAGSIAVESTSSAVVSQTYGVPGMNLQVTGACAAPGGASLTVKMSGGSSTFDYHADVQYAGTSTSGYRVANGNLAYITPGYNQLSWRSSPGTFNAAAVGMQGSGTITMHALVIRDGKSLTVDGYVFQSGTDCQAHAQVTPTG